MTRLPSLPYATPFFLDIKYLTPPPPYQQQEYTVIRHQAEARSIPILP